MLLSLVLAACGGGGTAEVPTTTTPPQALAVSAPGALVAQVQDTLRKRLASNTSNPAAFNTALLPSLAPEVPLANSTESTPRSGTLVQEAGVDESDLLLSQAEQIFSLRNSSGSVVLRSHLRDASSTAPLAQTLNLQDPAAAQSQAAGMMLNADGSALAVLLRSWSRASADDVCAGVCPLTMQIAPSAYRSSIGVQRVALDGRAGMTVTAQLNIDGRLVDSRRIGNRLYLVSSFTPATPLDVLPANASTAEREAAINRVSNDQLLPKLRRNNGTALALLADTDCYLQKDNGSLAVEITTVTVVDLGSADLPTQSRCFLGGTSAVYMSTSSLYLATSRWLPPSTDATVRVFAPDMQTDLHKFALQNNTVAYRGSGSVAGHLGWDPQRMSLRLSEHNGDLRVLSFTGDQGWVSVADSNRLPASPALLTVLREDAATASLVERARLPNSRRPALLGKPGEQVYGVRFVGSRAYVVTFRRTDPLYVLDLSNADDPLAAGELELAGFSEYLLPLGDRWLLGIGRSADSTGQVLGLQLALFDVSTASAPRLVSAQTVGGPGSSSALDASSHGLSLLQVGNTARLALPVNLFDAQNINWQQSLLRFEVDTSAGSLRLLSPVGVSGASFFARDVNQDRSLQIGGQVYYASSEGLRSFAW